MLGLAAILLGYMLDLIFGDPYNIPHPIRYIGKLIDVLEGVLRRVFPATKAGERIAGVFLVVLVVGISTGAAALTLWLCGLVSPLLAFAVASIMCYQMFATKSLMVESTKVQTALETGTLDEARHAVSMIVGRDTANLSEEAVAKAAVETVAENTGDGVVAPLLFMAVFGPLGGVAYKAVNTMDSMVGYKNDKYQYFGTAAALLDDVLNFIPARLAGVLMCAVAALTDFDAKGAWRVFKRDRLKHKSPNSAHTEAACAGALGVQLAGPNYYFGKLVEKPTIGDETRQVVPQDIARANRLMYGTSLLSVICGVPLYVLIRLLVGGIA